MFRISILESEVFGPGFTDPQTLETRPDRDHSDDADNGGPWCVRQRVFGGRTGVHGGGYFGGSQAEARKKEKGKNARVLSCSRELALPRRWSRTGKDCEPQACRFRATSLRAHPALPSTHRADGTEAPMITLANMSAVRARCGAAALPARASTSACTMTTRRASPSSASSRSPRRAATLPCRVVTDPMSSFDLDLVSGSFDGYGSIDVDRPDQRRAVVERDTGDSLRRTIAGMGGTQVIDARQFVSTDKQRLLCGSLFASCFGLVLRGCAGVEMDGNDPNQWAILVASMAAAYVLADAGTGIFHWSVDNYGTKNTPVLGNIIDAFQGHHKYPWTITKRQFANNVHVTCPAVMCVTVPLLCCPGLDQNVSASMGVFCAAVVLSQQFHAWSHMKPSTLPPVVVKAQEMGVLISRKGHGAHHKPPFRGNYCIVSGLWNGVLDGNGVFTKAEKAIYKHTGVAPRCWSDNDDFAVQEEAPEGWGDGIL